MIFYCNLSSIRGDDGSVGDDGSLGDEGSMGDDGSVGDLSDVDTASVVSNGSTFDALGEEEPEWHFAYSRPSHGEDNPEIAEQVGNFLNGDLDLPKKSLKQWLRFFFQGHRMKTIDPELMEIAHNLKWGMWCIAEQDYPVYISTIYALVDRMNTVGLLSTPFIG